MTQDIWNDLKYRLKGEIFMTKEDLWRRLKREWKRIGGEKNDFRSL